MPKSKRWFRTYDRMIDSPQILELLDSEFRLIVSLWCLASSEGHDGVLNYTLNSIRRRALPDHSIEDVISMVEHLKKLDLLCGEEGNYYVPRWEIHQYDYKSKIPKNRNYREENGKSLGSNREVIGSTDIDTDVDADTDLDKDISTANVNAVLQEDAVLQADEIFIKIVDYFSEKSGVLMLSPKDIELAKSLAAEIPENIIRTGIDESFNKYKPRRTGEKIRTLKYCEGCIRDIWDSIKAKEVNAVGTNKPGSRKNNKQLPQKIKIKESMPEGIDTEHPEKYGIE